MPIYLVLAGAAGIADGLLKSGQPGVVG